MVVVETISVDVSNADAVEKAARSVMSSSSSSSNVITHLFVCAAGEPHVLKYQDTSLSQYTSVTQTNQLGSIYVAHAFANLMTTGTITLTSSMAGQVGVFGYSAYSPTKFALRGFAEVLQMELESAAFAAHNKNIVVQLAYPPDTDTPGYALENIHKPVETVLISEVAGLATAQQIGQAMYRQATAVNPRLHVYFNLDGFLLCILTSGFSPVATWLDAVCQVSLLGFTRWIALFYLANWHRILRSHAANNNHASDNAPPNEAAAIDSNGVTKTAACNTESGKTSPSGAHKVD
jgi:3-dehydrosphinganine reductase